MKSHYCLCLCLSLSLCLCLSLCLSLCLCFCLRLSLPYRPRRRGSRKSRNQSPRMLSESTVNMIAMPGKSASHQ